MAKAYTKPPIVGMDPLHWINKDNSVNCSLCDAHFNFKKRKHNCRVCGNVFCGNCSKNKLPIQNASQERVCFICFTTHSTLAPDEQRAADEACAECNEFPQMRTLVFRKKDGKNNSRQHAVIVVTRYRIIRLKRGSSKVQSSFSLLELSKMTIVKRTMMILEFGKQTGNFVQEQFETAKLMELALTIRIQHSQLSLGMPGHCQLIVSAPDESYLLPLPTLQPIGVAGGFCDAYRAWCNFYSTPPSEELIQYITDSSERIANCLDLSLCPGIEPGTNVSFDLRPVFAALRYNNYYLNLSYCDVTAKGAMELLANCLRYNRTITKLQLSNLNTSYLTNVGHALSENKSNVIQDFDFSGTQISEKASKALGLSIIAKEYGIRELKFANCGLTGRGLGIIIREGLLANMDVSSFVETIDFSNNKLDEEGSILLQLWLSKVAVKGMFKHLNISKAGAMLNIIIPAFENLPLETIDVSGNVLDVDTCQIFSNFVINSTTLQSLNVSNCNLSVNSAGLLIAAASSNPSGIGIKLNFSSNNLEEPTNILFSSSLARASSLHTLDISSSKLSEKSLLNVIETLSNCATSLHTLVLNDLFGVISGHIPGARMAHLLADMTLLLPNLKSLSIGHNQGSFLGHTSENVILPFLQRMHRNSSLLQLSVPGNRLSDKLAVAIAEMLRYNTTLVELNMDDNRTTLTGFQAIEYSLHRNRTLQKLENPLLDIKRCMSSLSANEMKEKKLFTIISNIQLAVYFNRQSNGAHPLVEETPLPPPRSGPIFVFEGQSLPAEGPAVMNTPIPGVDYQPGQDAWSNNNNINNNGYSSDYNSGAYSNNNNSNNGYNSGFYDSSQISPNNAINNSNNNGSNFAVSYENASPNYYQVNANEWPETHVSTTNTNKGFASLASDNNNNNGFSNSGFASNNNGFASNNNNGFASNSQWAPPTEDTNRSSDLYSALASVLGDM